MNIRKPLAATRRHPFLRSTLAGAALATLLAACGGGSSSSDTAAATAPVQRATALYFTDDFAAEHEAVWISVTRVTAVGPNGETTLASFTPARSINLPTLKRAGELFATTAVPADTTAVRIYVDSQASVQQLDGRTLDVTLAAPQGWLEVRLEGWDRSSGVLALDFDLPRFVLSGSTLTPATRLADSSDFAGWNQRFAEIEGTVTAVATGAITVQTRHHGTRQISTDSSTSWVSGTLAAWKPAVGERVEIYGQVSGQGADGLLFSARVVKLDNDSDNDDQPEVHGRVIALTSGVATVSVFKSKHGGPIGQVDIDLTRALFSRGTLAGLIPGAEIEADLQPLDAGWQATRVEVKGAASVGGDSNNDNDNDNDNDGGDDDDNNNHHGDYRESYAELKGRIVSVAGQAVTLRVLKVERVSGINFGDDVAVDLAGVYFEKGSAACLAAGVPLEVKGAVDAAGAFVALEAEIEGACNTASPVGDGGAAAGTPSTPSTPSGPVFLEVKGAITAVRAGEFDLSVYRIEHGSLALSSVTVRYSSSTYFEHLNPTALAVGAFVEVKGTLSGSVLDASKVELD